MAFATILFLGTIGKKYSHKALFKIGSLVTAIAQIMNMFIQSVFDAFIARSIYRSAREATLMSFFNFFYDDAANQKEVDRYIISKEIIQNLGAALALFISAFASLFITNPRLFFIISAVAAPLFILFLDDSKKKIN